MILREGEVIFIGTPQEVLTSQDPFVREFLRSGLGELQAINRG
jgi:ABC-type transporter Mla maintaining outer membrane lipid asymmetry ATPase subunit MlaF